MKDTYLDASAIVKLVRAEPESLPLRRYLRRRRRLISSALVKAEVLRAAQPHGDEVVRRARVELGRVHLWSLRDDVLEKAGELGPVELRTLDAIHLATALRAGTDLGPLVTYDERMAEAARELGLRVVSPR